MPLNPFEGRPGFRYIADPLGRLGFGRYVAERDLPDPFGRVMAPPRPEPELMDLGDLFHIQAPVGMTGRNDRRDVAKVESLLGRLGVLDLGETDGVTGFFGARTDEAVRKFQKDQGLRVDGLIMPEGPTLRALMARLRGNDGETTPGAGETPFVAREENPAPPMSERPPLDPRRETVRRIVENLLAGQRPTTNPPLATPLATQTLLTNATGDLSNGRSDAGPDSPENHVTRKETQLAAGPAVGVLPFFLETIAPQLGRAILGGLGAAATGSLSGDEPTDEENRNPADLRRTSPVAPPDPKLPNIPPDIRPPTKTETPASPPDVPQLPGFSMPEDRPDLVEVFPDQRDDLPQSLIVEHRGGPRTRKLNADIAELGRAINDEIRGDVEHIGGAIGTKGKELKETHLYGPDEERRLIGGSFLDIAFQSEESKRRLLINTVDAKASGDPSKREDAAAGRIIVNKESGDILVLIPKPGPDETIDMAELKDRLRPLFQEIQRQRDESDPRNIPELFKKR